MTELSDVFSETDKSEEATEVETETVDEQVEETAEDVTEEESTVEEGATTTVAEQDEAEPQEPDLKEKGEWTFAAYQDEKQKRQSLEQQLREMEQQLQAPREDDTDYISQSELKERMESFATKQVQQALFQDRLARHYDETKSKYDDFSEMEAAFAEMAKTSNQLKAQFLHSQNPAEFAYVQAKNAQLLQKYNGNIQAMLEDVQKQQSMGVKKAQDKPASKPKTPSLANASEAEKNSAPISAQAQLQEIFSDSQF